MLSCYWQPESSSSSVSVLDLAAGLGLRGGDGSSTRRPWAIFNVNILDMEGMERALDWVLYHVQKRRNSLEYHQSISAARAPF